MAPPAIAHSIASAAAAATAAATAATAAAAAAGTAVPVAPALPLIVQRANAYSFDNPGVPLGTRKRRRVGDLIKSAERLIGSAANINLTVPATKDLKEAQAKLIDDFDHTEYNRTGQHPTMDEVINFENMMANAASYPPNLVLLDAIIWEAVFDHDLKQNDAGIKWAAEQLNTNNLYIIASINEKLGVICNCKTTLHKMTRLTLAPTLNHKTVFERLSREISWAIRNKGVHGTDLSMPIASTTAEQAIAVTTLIAALNEKTTGLTFSCT